MRIRLTQHDLSPRSIDAARPVVLVGALAGVVIAATTLIAHWDEVHRPVPAYLSLLLVAAAGATAVVATLPRFDPFRTERLWLVVAIAICASVADFAATAGYNERVYDDFGPFVIGVLLLVLAPFAGPAAIVVAGTVAVAVQLIVVFGGIGYAAAGAPVGVVVTAATAPLIAFTVAAAVFSSAMLRGILTRHRTVNRATVAARSRARHQGDDARARILAEEVLPFFVEIASATRITVEQADRARELAEALEEAPADGRGPELGWLARLVGGLAAGGRRVRVDDEDAASAALSRRQIDGVVALVNWLAGDRTPPLQAIEIGVRGAHGRVEVRVDAAVDGEEAGFQRELARVVEVLSELFLRVEASRSGENTTVTMSDIVD